MEVLGKNQENIFAFGRVLSLDAKSTIHKQEKLINWTSSIRRTFSLVKGTKRKAKNWD